MAKSWFVWKSGPKGPRPVIYHVSPHEIGPDTKAYSPKILSIHEVPEDLQPRVDNQDCPFAVLTERFPAPKDDA